MRQRSGFALTALLLLLALLMPRTAGAQSKWGDVNGDGAIGAVDAQAILSAVVGISIPSGFTKANGDANCDASIGAIDAQIVLSYVVGINVSQFCVGNAMFLSLTDRTYSTFDATKPISVLGNGDKITLSTWTTSGSSNAAFEQTAYLDAGRSIDTRVQYGASDIPSRIYDASSKRSITIVQRGDRVDYLFFDATGQYVIGLAVVLENSKLYVARIVTNPAFSGDISAASNQLSFSAVAKPEAGLGTLVEVSPALSTFYAGTVGVVPGSGTLSLTTAGAQRTLTLAGLVAAFVASDLPSLALPAGSVPAPDVAGGIAAIAVADVPNIHLLATDQFEDSWGRFFDDAMSLNQSPQEAAVSGISALTTSGQLVSKDLGKLATAVGDPTKDILTAVLPASSMLATTGGPPPGSASVEGYAIDQGDNLYSLSGSVSGGGQVSISGTGGTRTISLAGSLTGTNFFGTFTGSPGTGSLNGSIAPFGSCQTQQSSGGQGTYAKSYNMGTGSGNVTFDYQAYSIPDAFHVVTGGATVFSTGGLVSGSGTNTFALTGSPIVFITVSAPLDGTAWDYTLSCPSNAAVTQRAPVAKVAVTLTPSSVAPNATSQATAELTDAAGNVLSGRTITWTSSNTAVANINSNGLVTGVAVGTSTISATSEGITGSALLTVCGGSAAVQMTVGATRILSAAEKASLCLGGGSTLSEYVLIPFNNTNVASATSQIRVTGTNTTNIQPGSLASLQPVAPAFFLSSKSGEGAAEWSFRERERRDLARIPRPAQPPVGGVLRDIVPSPLTGVAATPTLGSTVQINANLDGNTCDPKILHSAVVVAVLAHTIVLSDQTSPSGGYTTAEMAAFGQAFEDTGYPLDVANFGTPTDIDGNGRVAILFTPGVNRLPVAPGVRILGLQASRDLYPVSACAGSNEGEIFYMPVPDPTAEINTNYATKSDLSTTVLATLVHEFQHLINAGTRLIGRQSSVLEETWLNEGLSHIAEELLYYKVSGKAPNSNLDLAAVTANQAQLDAVNTYQVENLSRLETYMAAPETNSPFAQNDLLETRGAIWQLLRYSADRKGGSEPTIWKSMVNTTLTGQANFNAVLGDIITLTRDWSVAQFVDDAGLGVGAAYTNPSWNFRSLMPALNDNAFPLLTHALVGAPIDLTLSGGGAAYLRFGVAGNTAATISAAASSGQGVSSNIDFILVRTK